MTAAALPKSAARKVANAMAEQIKRVNRGGVQADDAEVRHLRAENQRLLEQVEYLRSILNEQNADHAFTMTNKRSTNGLTVDGIEVGTQADYARRWKKPAYQVCRWVDSGALKTVAVAGKRLLPLDQNPPAGTGRGRKKAHA